MSDFTYSQDALLNAMQVAAQTAVKGENNRLITLLVSQGVIWHAPESGDNYDEGDWVCVKGFVKGAPLLGQVHGLEL